MTTCKQKRFKGNLSFPLVKLPFLTKLYGMKIQHAYSHCHRNTVNYAKETFIEPYDISTCAQVRLARNADASSSSYF